MPDQRKATLYGVATVLLWSTVASAFKLSLRELHPLQLLLYAVVTSIIVLAVILAVQGKLSVVFSFTRRQYMRSLGLGILNPFLYYVILFQAYDRLPAQEAQPLNYTWAIVLALLSIPLLKQRLAATDLIATFVAYGGVVVIATRGQLTALQLSDPLGVGLALGSTVIWALYWIYNTSDQRDPVAGLLVAFVFGLPFVFTACCLFSTPVVTSLPGLLGAVYVGVFEMGLTFVLWLKALRLAENTSRVGNLIFISPFVSLVLIAGVVGERILPSTLIGLVLIVAGLVVQQLGRRPHLHTKKEQ